MRPSSSKVRGAVFDRLQQEVVGARVLDLCAGTGALAIEALSRGASHAVLVELDPVMVTYLRGQLAELDLGQRSEVWTGDASRILGKGRPAAVAPFDLVLFDPPYAALRLYEQVLASLAVGDWLADDAIVVVEWSPETRRGLMRSTPAASRAAAGTRTHSPSLERAPSPTNPAPTWGPSWVLDARREHGSTVLDFLHRTDPTTVSAMQHHGQTLEQTPDHTPGQTNGETP